jgi:AAA family ATP:ADP antiporter
MKFHGKPAIDTLYVRLGDGLAAATVLIAVHIFAIGVNNFILFNVSLVICWIVFTLMMIREHRKAVQSMENLS